MGIYAGGCFLDLPTVEFGIDLLSMLRYSRLRLSYVVLWPLLRGISGDLRPSNLMAFIGIP